MTVVSRPTLSRDAIADAALKLIDRDGLSGLSMRKLGAELGVEAMSLYHYVKNKDDLLDAVVEILYGEVELPEVADDDELTWESWQRPIRQALTSFYQVMQHHPASVELFAERSIKGPNGFLLAYWSYNQCVRLGLPTKVGGQLFQLVVAYVIGRAASDVGILNRDAEVEAALDTVEDPAVREFLVTNRSLDRDELFESGLDILMAGIAAAHNIPTQ